MEKLNKGRKPPGYNKRSEEQRIYDVRFCADLFCVAIRTEKLPTH